MCRYKSVRGYKSAHGYKSVRIHKATPIHARMYLAEKAKIFFPGGDMHMGKKKMISKKVTMVRKIFQKKKKI